MKKEGRKEKGGGGNQPRPLTFSFRDIALITEENMEGGGKREKSEEDKGRKEERGKWRGKEEEFEFFFSPPGVLHSELIGMKNLTRHPSIMPAKLW